LATFANGSSENTKLDLSSGLWQKHDPGLRQLRELRRLLRRVARLQAAEIGGDVDDVVAAQLRRHRPHHRVLARA